MFSKEYSFQDLLNIMKLLRSDDGCPWDRVQTHDSLRNATLEETYEVLDAIDNKDMDNLKEELGDILLHVVFHSQIASDNHVFTVDDVIHGICEKLIRRHPHVFQAKEQKTPDEVTIKWDEIKKIEKNHVSYSDDMKKVPKAMPALMRAAKVQKKARDVGFDFQNIDEAMSKVHEELSELQEAINSEDLSHISEEYGDLLFSIVNISRFFQLNPEFSLTNATEKFINRFEGIENLAKQQGLSIRDMTITQLDKLWEQQKELIRNNRKNDCL
ncbi:nucleoside triphosphate pyrophosphohydrolase [Vallitalea pronyensis]|uniref:Nucleoside triphosphate pyrophosphohydrolase n=2 Tax=Vallitalea pronyensis TaxID=1348613 RepID=A0A8J8MPH7_9FIRM|nr:nucleoside triphosphate pyrophosphohydrolase [Vallitalea pronyensis]